MREYKLEMTRSDIISTSDERWNVIDCLQLCMFCFFKAKGGTGMKI